MDNIVICSLFAIIYLQSCNAISNDYHSANGSDISQSPLIDSLDIIARNSKATTKDLFLGISSGMTKNQYNDNVRLLIKTKKLIHFLPDEYANILTLNSKCTYYVTLEPQYTKNKLFRLNLIIKGENGCGTTGLDEFYTSIYGSHYLQDKVTYWYFNNLQIKMDSVNIIEGPVQSPIIRVSYMDLKELDRD